MALAFQRKKGLLSAKSIAGLMPPLFYLIFATADTLLQVGQHLGYNHAADIHNIPEPEQRWPDECKGD